MQSVSGVGTLCGRSKTLNGGWLEWQLNDVFYIEGYDGGPILSAHLFISNVKPVKSYRILKDKYVEDPQLGTTFLELVGDDYVKLKRQSNLSFMVAQLYEPSTAPANTSERLLSRLSHGVSFASGKRSPTAPVDINYAHMLLAHPGEKKMRAIKRHNLVAGLDWGDGEINTCYPCALGKSKRNPTSNTKSETVYTKRGQLIVTDVEGPIATSSFSGNQFAVHFTDCYSRFSVVYFLKKKNEVGKAFERYLKEYCDPAGIKVLKVQSDGAKEYIGADSKFQQVCRARRIISRHSSPYCHWENGIAERVIRTMMEKSFSILAQRDLPAQFWAMALRHAYMVANCLPHSHFDDADTPYRRWYDERPDFSRTHLFGCDVRVNIPLDSGYKKYKDAKAFIGIYVGWSHNSSSHQIWRPSSRVVLNLIIEF